MPGAVIGDIIGSVYEFEGHKSPEFPLFGERSDFTDGTVCTIAVAESLLDGADPAHCLRLWALSATRSRATAATLASGYAAPTWGDSCGNGATGNFAALERYLEAYAGIKAKTATEDAVTALANAPVPGAGANGLRQAISMEEFRGQLDRRSEIGEAGERIALEDELQRLRIAEVGCPDPARYVKHIALTDVGRGYDIESTWPGHERYIEVKSSTSSGNAILMSDNERSVLKQLGKNAWLYRVVVDASGGGEVVLRFNDPMSEIPDENFSTAVWRVRLPGPDK